MFINATYFLERKKQYIRRKRGFILGANFATFYIATCNISPGTVQQKFLLLKS